MKEIALIKTPKEKIISVFKDFNRPITAAEPM